MAVFESILIEQTFDKPNFTSLKFVKVANVATANIVANYFTFRHIVLLLALVVIIFLLVLDLLFNGFTTDLVLATSIDSRPGLENQKFGNWNCGQSI